jgi:hypothetical protein
MSDKHCVDCKHFGYFGYLRVCGSPLNGINLVTGKPTIEVASFCRTEAASNLNVRLCGKGGDFFERKPLKQPSTFFKAVQCFKKAKQ